jgi:hypothetical protein
MYLTKDMEHVNLCDILWYIHLYKTLLHTCYRRKIDECNYYSINNNSINKSYMTIHYKNIVVAVHKSGSWKKSNESNQSEAGHEGGTVEENFSMTHR